MSLELPRQATIGAIRTGSTNVIRAAATAFTPDTTGGTYALGSASRRWSEVFAATGTINTSDGRHKDWRGGLSEAELRVAKQLSSLIGVYRWKGAVSAKGDAARLHCGVIAQEVISAFEAEGLDTFEYGIACFDEWAAAPAVLDEDGNVISEGGEAGDLYGVRYDELLLFVAAGFEARLESLERGAD
jgi:hypothetical protein